MKHPRLVTSPVGRLVFLVCSAGLLVGQAHAQPAPAAPGTPITAQASSAPALPLVDSAKAAALANAGADDVSRDAPAAQDPPPATDAPAPSRLAEFLGETTMFVTADGYYAYNTNRPDSGNNVLRNFDEKDNQFALSYLEVAFEQIPTETRRLGFRADIGYGPTATWVGSTDPDEGRLKNLQQGYLSYLAPVGRGVQIDVGKFLTPIGAEPIEASANWNYSRSLLFAWAAPYYHVGVRAAVPVHDKVTVTGFLVNGWNNAFENNRGKTVGVQVSYKPIDKFSISQAWLGGPEQPNGESSWRHIFDTVATWHVHPRLSLMGNVDIGRDEIAGQEIAWHGVAAYARAMVSPTWYVTPRIEWFEDEQGFATGTAQTLREFTLTSEHTLLGGLSAKVEYRKDWSDQEFFEYRSGQVRRSQHTVLVGLIYSMQSK